MKIPPLFFGLIVSGLTALTACTPTNAKSDAGQSEPKPTAQRLRSAVHAEYKPPTDRPQECLGRLVFDAPRDMQWGVNAPGLWSGDRFRFTQDMHGGQDYVGVGNVKIVVSAPAKWSDVERMARATAAEKNIGIHQYQTSVDTKRRIIKDLESVLKDPSKNVNDEDLSTFPEAIAANKENIANIEARIANIEKDWHPMDLGLPDSLGYAGGPTLYAFLLRDGRAYQFMSTGGEGEPPFEERKRAFFDMLKRFEVRAMYAIPKAPGICIPFGFIPDDGRGHSRIEVSLRYADRPGVIYTLGTAVVGERGVSDPEAAMLTATARAEAGTLSGALAAGRATKSIGPRQVNVGALPAWQGGVSMNVADPGKPAVRSYSVYTGLAGFPHSRVLTNITVNLRSFTKEQEHTLTADPPPIEESMARLDALLKSVRLRPTDPVMPELVEEITR